MSTDKILAYLETYKGRDSFLRLLCYASKCAAGLTSPSISHQLDNMSKQLSYSRTAFRLLDDLPTLVAFVKYGYGRKDENLLVRTLNILNNILGVVFVPVDHISWAIDHKIIISKNSTLWDTLNTALWAASLYLNIMIYLKKISLIFEQKEELMENNTENRDELKKLSETQSRLALSTLKSGLDLMYAVNYLPQGFLWAGSLSKWKVGALGTLSSLIGLYQNLIAASIKN